MSRSRRSVLWPWQRLFGSVLGSVLAMVVLPAAAHHSPYVHYDGKQMVEIEGVVTEFEWRNPHTRFNVEQTTADGKKVLWNMEYSPPVILMRQGVTKDTFKVGSKMKFAGFKAANSNTMFVTNILLPDGRETYNDEYAPPRWNKDPSQKVGEALIAQQERKVSSGGPPPQGIFRVWSNDFTDRTPNKLFASASPYVLTDYAQSVKAHWDPVKDNPYIFCRSGMPTAMDQVHPMRFSHQGDDIKLEVEEYDVVRTIHMKGNAPPAGQKAGPYGYSVGRWDGDTLVVTTTNIDYPWFDKKGTPASPELKLVERFTVTPDNKRLDYTITATDPKVFKEPVVMKRQWLWVPGETITPYHCQFSKSDLGVGVESSKAPAAEGGKPGSTNH
ncbi:MAG TPA: DUF6152 family protein [Steroidobacteraceae bacterium]|nr:DUF6152 family protein [Steroidobacteraceae bacterium]